jgi:simple sugar transport system permease protein
MTAAPVSARGRRSLDLTAVLTGVFGSVASLAIALAIAAVVVGLSGYDVAATAGAMFQGSLGSSRALASTIQAAVPLTLVALGFTLAFRSREINIGLEGQAIAGGIAAVAVAVALPDWFPDAARLTALVAAAAAGALLAGGAVALQITRGVNLVISTFLSNFIMILVLSWLIRGPMQAEGTSLGISNPVPLTTSWPHFGASPLSHDVWLLLVLIVVLVGFERLTRPGLMARVVGSNPDFAVYSGIPVNRYRAGAVIASGALAGLAGASIVLAPPQFALVDHFTGEVGYIGIAVALLARGSFIACFVAGLLIAGLQQGTSFAQIIVGVPGSLGQLIQGTVIIVTGALGLWLSSLARRALHRRRHAPPVTDVEATPEKVPA